jgi:glycosyltransferase involved in cell wall biosynthesis
MAFLGPIFEKLALKLPASVIHTVSETSKKDLIACNVKSPIVVVPNAISSEDYNSLETKKFHDLQAIYIGRLIFYKNLEIVIKAFRDVLNKIPGARLVIVGDGPYRKHLQHAAEDLSNVIFVGRVANEKKVELLKESSFLVLPSLVEGFGIVVLEAFACKKPALVSNVMPLPEIVEDSVNGFTISASDSNAWADKMLYLFNNPQQAQKMGANGYEKLMRKYTIELAVDKIEKIYKLLLQKPEGKSPSFDERC